MADNKFRKGSKVEWKWGGGTATGKIKERFEREVTRKLKGEEVTRKGSEDDPAYLVEQDDGDEVLKLGSELKDGG